MIPPFIDFICIGMKEFHTAHLTDCRPAVTVDTKNILAINDKTEILSKLQKTTAYQTKGAPKNSSISR